MKSGTLYEPADVIIKRIITKEIDEKNFSFNKKPSIVFLSY